MSEKWRREGGREGGRDVPRGVVGVATEKLMRKKLSTKMRSARPKAERALGNIHI